MKTLLYIFITSIIAVGSSCSSESDTSENSTDVVEDVITNDNTTEETPLPLDEEVINTATNAAKIVSVVASGSANSYTFNVGISSPDTGCDQYADWWEVLTEDGELVYRRILAHSHVTEQPFVRSGSGINVTEDQILIVRAHMNTSGYSAQAYKGSVNSGFEETTLEEGFASEVSTEAPLPDGCAF